MFLDVVFAGLLTWMIAGGGYQVMTGRDAGTSTFRSSNRTPRPGEVRISGGIAALVGLALVPVLVGLVTGALGPK